MVVTTVRMTPELHAAIKAKAKELEVSMNTLWLQAMYDFLQIHEEEVTKLLFSKEVGGTRVQVGEGGGKVFVLWGTGINVGDKLPNYNLANTEGGLTWHSNQSEAVAALKKILAALVTKTL